MAYVSLILTFGLLIVTAWYGWMTKLMVDEMKEGRAKSMMPIITCTLRVEISKSFDDSSGYETGLAVSSYIAFNNIGNSPAINANLELRLLDVDNSDLNAKAQQWFLGTVAVNDKNTISDLFDLDVSGFCRPIIKITCIYLNTYGLKLKTTSEYGAKSGKITDTQDFEWKKLKEEVSFTK